MISLIPTLCDCPCHLAVRQTFPPSCPHCTCRSCVFCRRPITLLFVDDHQRQCRSRAAEMIAHVAQNAPQADLRSPAGLRFDLSDVRDAPAHVLEA